MIRRSLTKLHTATLSCLLLFACGADEDEDNVAGDDSDAGSGSGGGDTDTDPADHGTDETGDESGPGDGDDSEDSADGNDDASGSDADDDGGDDGGSGGGHGGGDDGGTGSGGGDDGGTGSTGGDAGGTSGSACTPSDHDFELQRVPSSAVLMLDKSGSMNTPWDHDSSPHTSPISRWNSLYHVVESLLDEFADNIDFGAQLVPAIGASTMADDPASCIVSSPPEVPVGPANAANILASIPGPDDTSLTGGTPTTSALQSAVDHLLSIGGPAGRALVLVTDGAANCAAGATGPDITYVYDTNLPVVVRQVHDDYGIPTYVIGIDIVDEVIFPPAVNPHDALTDVAIAGGVPKNGPESFHNVSDEAELFDALATISEFIECSISLPAEPDHPDLVEVQVDGVPVPQVTDCNTEDGWVFPNQGTGSYNTITLCGNACVAGDVHVAFNCP